jgi:hypothetical protein
MVTVGCRLHAVKRAVAASIEQEAKLPEDPVTYRREEPINKPQPLP